MSKSQRREANKRRHKRQAKKKRARAALRKKWTQAKPEFDEAERTYWMAHGVNFLSSNYDEGEWTPLFPEVYEDAVELSEEVMAARLTKLAKVEEAKMTATQKAILGYALQSAGAHLAFKKNAERLLKLDACEDPEATARLAHQPIVWQMFHDEIMVKAMSRAAG